MKKAVALLLRLAASACILTGLVILLATFSDGSVVESSSKGSLLGWQFLSSFLATAALALVILGARASRMRAAAGVFALFFIVRYVNTMDEAIFFHLGVPLRVAVRTTLGGLIIAAIFASVLALLLGSWERVGEPQPRATDRWTLSGWLWRLAAGDILYVLFYLVAGSIVFPFVRSFYQARDLPTFPTLVEVQICRGSLFMLVAILTARMMAGEKWRAAVTIGLAFSILGGIAPLVVPNPYMPGYARLAHGFEVGISNFLYGICLGLLFTPRNELRSAERHLATAKSLTMR